MVDKRDVFLVSSKKGYYVYFYYNKNILLYVGLTTDLGKRFLGHQESWMSEVTDIGIRQYSNSTSMNLLEKYYIAKLKPKYNIRGATTDILDIEIKDSKELNMVRKKFISKYCRNEDVSSKRITFREKLTNINCKRITVDTIDLFEESTLSYNLDETVFLCNNSMFYFNDDIINYKSNNNSNLPTTNMKIIQLKKFFSNERNFSLNNSIMPFVLYFVTPKSKGGVTIISSIVFNQEKIATDIKITNYPFIIFSKNKLIIDFNIITKS